MTEERPDYDGILKENEDLLVRNSELELENTILKEGQRFKPRSPVNTPPPPPVPPPPRVCEENPPTAAICQEKEHLEDDDNAKINVQVDFTGGARIVRIKTDLGKTMYTVSILSNPDGTFLVKVWKFGNLVVPVEIVREEFDEDGKTAAETRFRKLVVDYTNLVKAETQVPDPRKIFDDCVDYHVTDPDCCRNCRYSVKEEVPDRKFVKPRKPRTICVNRKNVQQYERILMGFRNRPTFSVAPLSCGEDVPDRDQLIKDPDGTLHSFDPTLKAFPNPRPCPAFPVELDVKVVVDPRGLCKGYERGDSPAPGRYEDPKSFEFDRDLMVIISNMVDDKVARVSQEDVIVYCGDSVDTAGRH